MPRIIICTDCGREKIIHTHGLARQGKARQGKARHGTAGSGRARQGTAG